MVLTCLSGRAEPRRCTVDGPLQIGRDPQCDLRCFDESVSRFHCRLKPGGDGLVVEDCGARNGVLLDGARIERATAVHGSTLTIGAQQFLIEDPTRSADQTRLLTDQGSALSSRESDAPAATDAAVSAVALRLAGLAGARRAAALCEELRAMLAADRVGLYRGADLLAGDIEPQLANRLAGGSRPRLLRLGEELVGQTVAAAAIGSALVAPVPGGGHLIALRGIEREPLASDQLPRLLGLAALVGELPRADDADGGLLGGSRIMGELRERLRRFAASAAPVLITGESGCGKELAARALHDWSPRRDGPFVAVNCAAVAEALFEAELFGHAKGAFTGADRARLGLLRSADGGTVLLDEIGELPLGLQAKLLRCLQEGEVQGVGEARPQPIAVRVVAATNRDLLRAVIDGAFREDLLFRLDVLRVHMPALREHAEDIPLLVGHLLRLAASREGCSLPTMSAPAMQRLQQQPWPGNVRQLENCLLRAAVLAGERIDVEHIGDGSAAPPAAPPGDHFPTLSEVEAAHIRSALAKTDGNKSEAARLLGISRPTIRRKIAEYGLPD